MTTTSALRIVVSGLAATYPYGGVFWDYIQYLLGFHKLGHEVLYLEDTGRWCYDPVGETFVEDGRRNALALGQRLAALHDDLAGRWFFRDSKGHEYGRPYQDVVEFCRTADLFLNVSAACWMRDEYRAAPCRTAFIDSDPMYTQAALPGYLAGELDEPNRTGVDRLLAHDVHFTFGENIHQSDCLIPTGPFKWIPTRQPIDLNSFRDATIPLAQRRRVLTTVASWEPTESGPKIAGVQYHGKSREFERFITLPSRVAIPLEIALSGPAPLDRLRDQGWQIRSGREVSYDPWSYRGYLADSLAEWSVAKNAYVAGRTGWFSCRTACYLALGVPAVVQGTGFEHVLPTGEGLLAFDTLDEAADGIDRLLTDPQRHATAARAIAEEYFEAGRVLSRLIADAMNG